MVDITPLTKPEALAWYNEALSVGGSGGASAAFIIATVRVTGGHYNASDFTVAGSIAVRWSRVMNLATRVRC